MQQKRAELTRNKIALVVVVDQNATALEALEALGADTDVPLLIGTAAAYSIYRVAGVPANYLIDPKGRLITQTAGSSPTLAERWLKLVKDIEAK